MAQQVGDPFSVFDIGLSTRHGLDVTCIGDQDIHACVFQDVVDRLPKDAR